MLHKCLKMISYFYQGFSMKNNFLHSDSDHFFNIYFCKLVLYYRKLYLQLVNNIFFCVDDCYVISNDI